MHTGVLLGPSGVRKHLPVIERTVVSAARAVPMRWNWLDFRSSGAPVERPLRARITATGQPRAEARARHGCPHFTEDFPLIAFILLVRLPDRIARCWSDQTKSVNLAWGECDDRRLLCKSSCRRAFFINAARVFLSALETPQGPVSV